MNTKPIPAIIMLVAGLTTCIISIVQHFSLGTFVTTLFCVLLIFYLLGCIARVVLDKGFRVMQDPLSEFEDSEMDEDLVDDSPSLNDDWD
ncbi:MAG: hypothetical protein PUD20_06340 [bacterium]|nr:hypothetical protein [bacterium]